ncbi:MAG: acetamidase/formamidase family protein [Candidatus Deferrimicrobium sp.]
MRLDRVEENIRYLFSPEQAQVATIESGETITVETRDASNGQIRPGGAGLVNRARLLPITGPIAVTGAEPGDAIAITIESIRFMPVGHAWIREGNGLRQVRLETPYHVQAIPVGERVLLPGGLSIPLRPMLGIVGVSPEQPVSTRSPGEHGGNLDCPDISPGNTLWLPVFVPGANVSIGDAHAAMGDGEVSGTGVETEASVDLTVTLHKRRLLDGPVVATLEKTVFLSSGPTLDGAIRKALDRAIEAIALNCHLHEKDAYIVASVSGNIRICQVVNGNVTVGYEVPREVLPW